MIAQFMGVDAPPRPDPADYATTADFQAAQTAWYREMKRLQEQSGIIPGAAEAEQQGVEIPEMTFEQWVSAERAASGRAWWKSPLVWVVAGAGLLLAFNG